MKRRCRPAPTQAAAPLERDREVLRSLAWARYLGTGQIAALHFPSRRVAQRRLRALLDRGFVGASLQGGALHADSIFRLAPAGVRWLAEDGADEGVLAATRAPRLRSLPHGLAVRDVFVVLRRAEARAELVLDDFLFEGDLMGAEPFRRVGIVPDALAVLGLGEGARRLAFEIDLGTEPLAVLRGKFARYASAFAAGAVDELVVVVHGARRLLATLLEQARLPSSRVVHHADLAQDLGACSRAPFAPPLRPARTPLASESAVPPRESVLSPVVFRPAGPGSRVTGGG